MTDSLLCDVERLRTLAPEAAVRQGLACFKAQRVVELGLEDGVVSARVQTDDGDDVFAVTAEADATGALITDCDCGDHGAEPGLACQHVVAVLLAHTARQPVSEAAIRSAAEAAVGDRAHRGRTEVSVVRVQGQAWPSIWTARSLTPSPGSAGNHRVEIRSLTERINLCTCPDFAHNRLGTCKHIEAALHRLRKGGRRSSALAEPDRALVHVEWDAAGLPRVRLRRSTRTPPGLAALLSTHFDPSGFLRGPLPDAFDRLSATLGGRADVYVGADAVALAYRAGQEAAHALRSGRIRAEILASGGRLEGVLARLYPYQVEGVAFLAATGRAVLADDMGLGKTLQAIAAATWLMQREGLARVLVVCPASLKRQWAREVERFTQREVVVVEGGSKARAALYGRQAAFTVVNYELAVRDVGLLNDVLCADLLVLDEAQRLKNWRTQTAARVKNLRTDRVFVLTGTPLENRLEDLYSVMQLVDQRVLGPLWQFMLHFHVLDDRGKVLGYRNLSELRRRLAPVMLRRDRRLVRDQLPGRIETQRDLPLTPAQQDHHDGALQSAKSLAQIAERRPLTPVEEKRLLSALQMARMACDAAGLVDGVTEGSPKLEELARLLEELCLDGGRKVVVFSQWQKMIAMAERVARDLGLGTACLHGGVPTDQRGALIQRFHDDPATHVFLSTDAGGVGLNLQCASALVNLDLPWNPAVLDQRLARIHRLGQREPVQIVLLVSRPSYEERVGAILASKRHLFTHVISEDASEDVVGLSKRTMDLALEALRLEAPSDAEPPAESDASAAESEAPAPLPRASEARSAPEPPAEVEDLEGLALNAAVQALQSALGGRIDRLLVSGGVLLVLVDTLDDEVRLRAREAAGRTPVTVLDVATWELLRRFSGAGAFEGATELERASEAIPSPPPMDPLLALARRKLDAARALRAADCLSEALENATLAMLCVLARRAGRSAPPAARDAAAWLYGEAVPAGHAAADEALAVLRCHGLSQAESVPASLADEALADAGRWVEAAPRF